jgi:hypothetical protein
MANDNQQTAAQKAELKKTAATRMTRAIKSIEAIGNLYRYKPSKGQQEACIKALQSAVLNASKDIAKVPGKTETLFNLPD